MKILHLVSSSGLFGAERVILNLASQNNGIVFWVGALNNQHNPHLEIIKEAQNLDLKTVIFDSRTQVDFKTVFSIKSFLKEKNIDILHTHNYKSDIMGFLATSFTQVKWVATNHVWHSTDKKLRFYEGLDAFVLKFAALIFTVSQDIKDDLLNRGFKNHNIHVIHNGIAINQFGDNSARKHLRSNWNIFENDVLLTIVGRLAPEKGHEILFKALSNLTQYPFIKCLVVGEGLLKNDLESSIKRLNLSNQVIFAGIRTDMPAVYSACDILINSSFIEGLPMTILEAMASHLPMIVTKVGAVPQVIRNQVNGVVLEAGNEQILFEAIIELANDPAKRKRLAQEAYKDVCERFSDQRMAEDYKKYYQLLLK